MRTIVYVDGFNLYYGCLRRTPYKWLNLNALCEQLLPLNEILKIKYYTARVTPREDDLDCHVKQQIYIRALQTIPTLEIHYGHYLTHIVSARRANPVNGEKYVKVIKTEEKGSDVNLASQLLVDAAKNRFDVGVIVSNDSDLLAPIQLARSEFGKRVGVLNPHKNPARALLSAALFFKPIRRGVLELSQFPPTLTDRNGEFHKPEEW